MREIKNKKVINIRNLRNSRNLEINNRDQGSLKRCIYNIRFSANFQNRQVQRSAEIAYS